MAESVPKEQAEAVLTALFGATRADFVRAVDAGIAPLGEGDGRRVSLARQLLMLTPRRLTEFVRDLEALIDSYDSGSEPDAIPVAVLHVVYPSTRKHP
ncbi:MAG: hypothetical protein EHM57_06100 [Actinobacteria bacterium]|nr:MAG: hypothetical protein EHM57_06100 [Actinomycetota bacterium]